MRRTAATLAVVALVALCAAGSSGAASGREPQARNLLGGCASGFREAGACKGYIFAVKSRVVYYMWARSSNSAQVEEANHQLALRYRGQATRYFKNLATGWPVGANKVFVPFIVITDVNVKGHTAHLGTEENWPVLNRGDGKPFVKVRRRYFITMKELPARILGTKWVVTQIRSTSAAA